MVTYRRSFIKSRNGCLTCKIRHVKCDETHPSCRRCTSTGRTCDGYNNNSANSKMTPSSSSSSLSTSWSMTFNPTFNSLASSPLESRRTSSPSPNIQDHRAFAFFRSETAPNIGGYFGTSAWNLALQACTTEMAVSQALIALGAIHESTADVFSPPQTPAFSSSSSRPIATDFPLQKYQQALSSLRRYLASSTARDRTPDLNIVLICALIHICIEVMLNNYVNAVVHLDNSLLLIKGASASKGDIDSVFKENDSTDTNAVDLDLTRAFLRLDIHASMYQCWRPPSIAGSSPSTKTTNDENNGIKKEPIYTSIIPGRFTSLAQAKALLDHLTATLFTIVRGTIEPHLYRRHHTLHHVEQQDCPSDCGLALPFHTVASVQRLKADLEAWSDRFEKYLNRSTSRFSRHEQMVINLLVMNHRITLIDTATVTSPDMMLFDTFDNEFDEIVTLGASVIRARSNGSTSSSSPLSGFASPPPSTPSTPEKSAKLDFSIDMGVIYPLYKTAIRCREPWIRQRALSLLKSITFQEGVWSAAAQAAVAEAAIRKELEFCGEGGGAVIDAKGAQRPPAFARFQTVGTQWIDMVGRRAEVSCTRRLNGVDGPFDEWVEIVSW